MAGQMNILDAAGASATVEARVQQRFTRLPTVSLGAEYLVMGYLMRRNILAYKAPPNNEGYDLICIHPDSRKSGKQIRVQVKSRFATDCDRGFPVKSKTLDAFDYVVVVFLNIGYYLHKAKGHATLEGQRAPELYVLPATFVRQHHKAGGKWEKVATRGLDLSEFEGFKGIEMIAKNLKIPYPQKAGSEEGA
jgi:hypothetical protein